MQARHTRARASRIRAGLRVGLGIVWIAIAGAGCGGGDRGATATPETAKREAATREAGRRETDMREADVRETDGQETDVKTDVKETSDEERALARARRRMVETQVESRGIRDERVLDALRAVPRHRFAPNVPAARVYEDRPQPIGQGQTISQPYIVALMSELGRLDPPCRVLEVGTGSGYQAAVLAEMGCEVFTIEIIEPLARQAQEALDATGFADRVHARVGDGYGGWPEAAPFDAILVTAAAPRVPTPLLEQLAPGGRLVIPVGESWQTLEVHHRTANGIVREQVLDVRFVPMTGEVRAPQ